MLACFETRNATESSENQVQKTDAKRGDRSDVDPTPHWHRGALGNYR